MTCRWGADDERSDTIRSLIAAGVAGMIVDGGCDEPALHLLTRNKVPVVVYDGDSPEVDSVFLDRESGVFSAMEHLFLKGRKRTVLLGATESDSRHKAYTAAHADFGVETRSWLIVSDPTNTTSNSPSLKSFGECRILSRHYQGAHYIERRFDASRQDDFFFWII
ncbi:MAG: LacI family transcriptional regulator [Kiritimatiellaeota bacterium]|nr:LacI family transcriptional regulator [Kiritimatiellota bacterium]